MGMGGWRDGSGRWGVEAVLDISSQFQQANATKEFSLTAPSPPTPPSTPTLRHRFRPAKQPHYVYFFPPIFLLCNLLIFRLNSLSCSASV